MRAVPTLCLALTFCVVLSACSTDPKAVKANGTLLQNGKPYAVAKGSSVLIVFVPMVATEKGATSPATKMKPNDSSFRFDQGISPGEYRVHIQQLIAGGGNREVDDMNQRFGKDNSPIQVEVKDETPLRIDLANY